MDKQKLQEVFSDKAYVESIVKMSAEDAAESLREKGVEVTAEQLMEVRDFLMAHKDELQNGELSEEKLADIAGGMSREDVGGIVGLCALFGSAGLFVAAALLW